MILITQIFTVTVNNQLTVLTIRLIDKRNINKLNSNKLNTNQLNKLEIENANIKPKNQPNKNNKKHISLIIVNINQGTTSTLPGAEDWWAYPRWACDQMCHV